MRALAVLLILAGVLSGAAVALAQDSADGGYISECAGCHGPQGEGTEWAPSIRDEGAAGADFMMRTGRMPLLRPEEPIERRPPRLTEEQIRAITDYVGRFGGPEVPDPDPGSGEMSVGAGIYLVNCAACHGSTGVGAALVASENAPSILRANALDVAEAVRSGPRSMPAYGPDAIDDHELDSLALYVTNLVESRNRGGWALGRWGPVAEGAAAWLIGIVAVLAAAVWIEGSSRDRGPEGDS